MIESPVFPNAHVQNPTKKGLVINPDFDSFYKGHQKAMWHFDQIPFDRINKNLLTEDDLVAVSTAMKVESHNPVYTSQILAFFRQDHEMTSFVVVWGYEEMKHYLALRTYLEATGLVNLGQLERDLTRTRAGQWGERESQFTPAQSYAYTTIQEQVTGRFYQMFADHTREPVLKGMLRLIGKDEYRHCQYYLGKAQQEQEVNPQAKDEIDEVLLEFGMPGSTFIEGYSEGAEVMNRISQPKVIDLVVVLKKVGEMVGYNHMIDLAERPDYKKVLQEKWGIDPEAALRVVRPLHAAAKLLPFN